MGSTPRSCSPTSSCHWPRSASASRSCAGTGPSSRSRSGSKSDLDAPPTARGGDRPRPRDRRRSDRRGRARRPLDRLRRGALHARELPHRGRPVPHVRADKVRSCTPSPSSGMALPDRLADLALASLRAQVDAGRRAIQLFDSWAGALSPADYAAIRPSLPRAKVLAGARGARRAPDPLRRRHRRAARPHGRCRGRRDRRRLARAAHRPPRFASGRERRCRATSTRRSASRLGGRGRPRRRQVLARPQASRATSSTSATACCRRPTLACSPGSSRSSTRGGPPRGDGSGVTGAPTGCSSWRTGRRRRPHRWRPSTPTSAAAVPRRGAARRARRALRGDRRGLPATARAPPTGGGDPAAAGGRLLWAVPCTLGNKHSDPRIEDCGRAARRRRRPRIVGLVLAPALFERKRRRVHRPCRRARKDLGLPTAFHRAVERRSRHRSSCSPSG